jgi:dynein heavy chain
MSDLCPYQVLRSLSKTYQNLKRKPVAVDLDPKAVTCDELFGVINPATREWKDGNGRSYRGHRVPLGWLSCSVK